MDAVNPVNGLTVEGLVAATGGAPVGDWPAGAAIRRVVTDSRWIKPGDLFVCLEGPRFDGHTFAAEALEEGALGVVAHRDVPAGVPHLRVTDTLEALQDLALATRRIHDASLDGRVIGITGTNGKTSTKDLAAAALGAAFPCVASERSFNNAIGVPLTLLAVDADTEALVVELGTNRPGEIAAITRLARPEIGVITNIDRGHLAGLGSLEGVREEKVSLLAGLVGRQVSVLNRDDPSFEWLAERAPGPVIGFGCDDRADVVASDVRLSGRDTRFVIDGRVEVTLRLLGRHAVSNALAAIAAACAAGVELPAAAAAVEQVLSPPGRLQVRELGDVTVIDDTYNANPGSLAAALSVLGELRGAGRLVIVMGDMLELGEAAGALHADAGKGLAGVAPGLVVAVGEQSGRVVAGATDAGLAAGAAHACAAWEQALDVLEQQLRPHDVVLVKGSRGVVLDRLVSRLVELAPQVA